MWNTKRTVYLQVQRAENTRSRGGGNRSYETVINQNSKYHFFFFGCGTYSPFVHSLKTIISVAAYYGLYDSSRHNTNARGNDQAALPEILG